MNSIKLVYDSYENDIGFIQSDEQGDHNHQLIEGIDRSKVITFYTWGKRKHDPIDCDLIFDLLLMSINVSKCPSSCCGSRPEKEENIVNKLKVNKVDKIKMNTSEKEKLV
jgi:hypothetical protein